MTKWEYKIAECNSWTDDLRLLGEEGWELVTIDWVTNQYYFKRLKKEEPELLTERSQSL